MPFPAPPKPTPIATLIKWYVERKKGKVVEARREIQRRFDYIDWKDQKKIIIAFLNSCMTDRMWIYKRLYHHWDDSLFPYIIETIKKYPIDINLVSGIIPYVPLSFIKEHYNDFSSERGYYYICRRYIRDKVDFEIDETRLHQHEYLSLLKEKGETISDEKAMDILFGILYKYATGYEFSIMDMQFYTEINPRHVVPRGIPFTAMDFRYIFILCRNLEDLGKDKVLKDFEKWNKKLADAIIDSFEFQELNKTTLSEYEYEEKRRMIAKRYIYKLLPDKYKLADESQPFADSEAILKKMKTEHTVLDELINKFDLVLSDSEVPF